MTTNSIAYVRTETTPDMPPPKSTTGAVGWMRENLFSSPTNTLLTFIGIYIIYLLVPPIIKFAFIDSIWSDTEGLKRLACLSTEQGGSIEGEVGSCWPFVKAKLQQFIFGRYPSSELWRPILVYIILAVGITWLVIESLPKRNWVGMFMLFVFPVLSFILLVGGIFGLSYVETPLWGGLLVTLVVAITGIVASLPLGILLALGRQSKMPVIRMLSIIFIEFWRGVPLITVLFMASVMLPLFLPEGTNFDKLLRCLIGVTLFSAAYMAEVVRGGLQAIPKGQYEGAQALGLSYWKTMGFIVLPQALKHVIPGIVNTFIGLFKDTTLVLIIGLFDLLGAVQFAFTDASWSTPVTSHTGYLFAAFVFWVFCFGMSRYSMHIEQKLHTGHKR